MKKILSAVTSLIFSAALAAANFVSLNTYAASRGINVDYHTKSEIIEYIKGHPFDTAGTVYDKKPNYSKAPYYAGTVSVKSLANGINALNTMRYIAGLDEVALSDEYNKLAQAGALVNAVNGTMAHKPVKPSDMSKELYDQGYKGTSSSNLGWGFSSIADAVLRGWMSDEDDGNIDRVGHRRWCLNPIMQKTGFGHVDTFTAMYAFDNFSTDTDQYGVCWPAQVMPKDYFNDGDPWSVSMGYDVNISNVKVILKRRSDGKSWSFSKNSSDGYFNVDNQYYGQQGCIIFRPNDLTCRYGDSFDVDITGLKAPVHYSVDFVSLKGGSSTVSDANGDGKFNVRDAAFIAKMLAQGKADKLPGSSDFNGDGKVDVRDAAAIAKYLAIP